MSDTILDKKFECFDLEIENKIAKLTLNRPEKLNSMIRSFWDELPEIITAIDQDALARVIVISSTGKHFSAGMDLSVFSQNDVTSSDNKNKKEGWGFIQVFLIKHFYKLNHPLKTNH